MIQGHSQSPTVSGAYAARKAVKREKAAAKANKQKHDWDLFRMLYYGGMECSEIVQQPAFADLSLAYAKNKVHEEGMSEKRKQMRSDMIVTTGKTLAQSMMEAGDIHKKWIMEKMTVERRVLDQSPIIGGKSQLQRLSAINIVDEITRRTLGLDQEKIVSAEERTLGMIIMMQGQHAPVPKLANAHEVAPENTHPLLAPYSDAGEHSDSITASKNGHGVSDRNEDLAPETEDDESNLPHIERDGLKPLPPFIIKTSEAMSLVNENTASLVTENTLVNETTASSDIQPLQ